MDTLDIVFDALKFSPKEKEDARKDFEVFIAARTTEDLAARLPEEDQEKMKVLAAIPDAEGMAKVLGAHFSEEEVAATAKDNFEKLLVEYLDFMLDGMSEEDRIRIAEALANAT